MVLLFQGLPFFHRLVESFHGDEGLLKDLDRQKTIVNGYRGNPSVSEQTLDGVVAKIDHAFNGLNHLPGKAGQALTSNDWLMSIRSRISIPGGTCEFDLPPTTRGNSSSRKSAAPI